MDTSLTLAPKPVVTIPYLPEVQRPSDTKVPIVAALESTATLPPEKQFVAQVVNARLSGTAFPDNPGEIAPPERTLRPYNVPMLPDQKEDPTVETEETLSDIEEVNETEQTEATDNVDRPTDNKADEVDPKLTTAATPTDTDDAKPDKATQGILA